MWRKETYIDAAREHADLAQKLYNEGDYGVVHYIAGLSVECMLRAYRLRIDPEFDSRHDLLELSKQAKFYDVIPFCRRQTMAASMSEVVQRWTNEHRFRSSRAIEKWLRSQKSNWRIKGNLLKESARRISNAAIIVVSEGVMRWPGN